MRNQDDGLSRKGGYEVDIDGVEGGSDSDSDDSEIDAPASWLGEEGLIDS